jgi:hypothetical protein
MAMIGSPTGALPQIQTLVRDDKTPKRKETRGASGSGPTGRGISFDACVQLDGGEKRSSELGRFGASELKRRQTLLT